MISKTRTLLGICLVTGVAALSGLYTYRSIPVKRVRAPEAVFTSRVKLVESTEHGVSVRLSLEADAQGRYVLRATYTPIEPGFHLYSTDLPDADPGGIGVPTKLEIPDQKIVRAAGPAVADAKPHDLRIDALGIVLPVYQPGPVTLRIPIEFAEHGKNSSFQVSVSYMACETNGQCQFPVRQKIVTVTVPEI